MDKLSEIINLSRRFGSDPEFVIAGGGNSSFKDKSRLWVKASGTSMEQIDKDGFVCLHRSKMQIISTRSYSNCTEEREKEVKHDLQKSIISPRDKRPSVEASLHEIIPYAFVMHTHPTKVNGVLCSKNSELVIDELFGDEVIYIRYTDPGYLLFKEVKESIKEYEMAKRKDAKIIFLENHGLIVGADTCYEIINICSYVIDRINSIAELLLPSEIDRGSDELNKIIKTLSGLDKNPDRCFKSDNSELSLSFVKSGSEFHKVSVPLTPDNIVYCKSRYLFVSPKNPVVEELKKFLKDYGYYPKIIAIEGEGLIAADESISSVHNTMDVYKDLMKVARLSESFGGPRPLSQREIEFIDNWEVENYRRKISKKMSK